MAIRTNVYAKSPPYVTSSSIAPHLFTLDLSENGRGSGSAKRHTLLLLLVYGLKIRVNNLFEILKLLFDFGSVQHSASPHSSVRPRLTSLSCFTLRLKPRKTGKIEAP
ncbi:MAG: hypothetical protein LBD95_00155, partial [Clostridiales Family XIII bacterium]|nr:hypothetical protein [Clostridiales Family XIII bacterium]